VRAPEITFRYQYPRDIAGPTFEILARTFDTGLTSATSLVLTLVGVPLNKILVLTNANIEAIPGTAQQIDEMGVQATTQAAQTWNISTAKLELADTIEAALNWQGEVYIQGRGNDPCVRMFGVFDGGVNDNRLFCSLHGIVIPRGNAGPF